MMRKVRQATPTARAGTLNPAQRKRGANPVTPNTAQRGIGGGGVPRYVDSRFGLGRGGGLAGGTPQIAGCQDAVFSSSDKTSTAVLKPAPQQGSWRDAGFPKQPGRNFTDGI